MRASPSTMLPKELSAILRERRAAVASNGDRKEEER